MQIQTISSSTLLENYIPTIPHQKGVDRISNHSTKKILKKATIAPPYHVYLPYKPAFNPDLDLLEQKLSQYKIEYSMAVSMDDIEKQLEEGTIDIVEYNEKQAKGIIKIKEHIASQALFKIKQFNELYEIYVEKIRHDFSEKGVSREVNDKYTWYNETISSIFKDEQGLCDFILEVKRTFLAKKNSAEFFLSEYKIEHISLQNLNSPKISEIATSAKKINFENISHPPSAYRSSKNPIVRRKSKAELAPIKTTSNKIEFDVFTYTEEEN